jgi:hypothetical protein
MPAFLSADAQGLLRKLFKRIPNSRLGASRALYSAHHRLVHSTLLIIVSCSRLCSSSSRAVYSAHHRLVQSTLLIIVSCTLLRSSSSATWLTPGANGIEELKAHPFFKSIDWEVAVHARFPLLPSLASSFPHCPRARPRAHLTASGSRSGSWSLPSSRPSPPLTISATSTLPIWPRSPVVRPLATDAGHILFPSPNMHARS